MSVRYAPRRTRRPAILARLRARAATPPLDVSASALNSMRLDGEASIPSMRTVASAWRPSIRQPSLRAAGAWKRQRNAGRGLGTSLASPTHAARPANLVSTILCNPALVLFLTALPSSSGGHSPYRSQSNWRRDRTIGRLSMMRMRQRSSHSGSLYMRAAKSCAVSPRRPKHYRSSGSPSSLAPIRRILAASAGAYSPTSKSSLSGVGAPTSRVQWLLVM